MFEGREAEPTGGGHSRR